MNPDIFIFVIFVLICVIFILYKPKSEAFNNIEWRYSLSLPTPAISPIASGDVDSENVKKFRKSRLPLKLNYNEFIYNLDDKKEYNIPKSASDLIFGFERSVNPSSFSFTLVSSNDKRDYVSVPSIPSIVKESDKRTINSINTYMSIRSKGNHLNGTSETQGVKAKNKNLIYLHNDLYNKYTSKLNNTPEGKLKGKYFIYSIDLYFNIARQYILQQQQNIIYLQKLYNETSDSTDNNVKFYNTMLQVVADNKNAKYDIVRNNGYFK